MFEQVNEKKRRENPISLRMKKRVDEKIEDEGKGRDTLLFKTSS